MSSPSDRSGPTPQPQPPTPSGGIQLPSIRQIIDQPIAELVEKPSRAFVSFLKISMRRAFRLRIDPSEVLPTERYVLEHANPPVLEPNLQAFLAWRRSVLFVVACALVPLTIVGLIGALAIDTLPFTIRMIKLGPVLAEAVFLLICWTQLLNWHNWRKQRRWLFWGWLLFMITPFIVFALPLREAFTGHVKAQLGMWDSLGFGQRVKGALQPFAFAMIAMLQLAPKAISLMPGLIRSSMVIKMLFPGSSAPGWLIAMSAPLYALLVYVILIVPYQFTGEPLFIAGIGGVVLGQAILARAGFKLARPLTEAEALVHIVRVRFIYLITMVVSGGLIIAAMSALVMTLHLKISDVFLAVLKFESNVLVLTMVFSDLVVTNLDRARSYVAPKSDLEEQTEIKIAAFVGLDAPPVPPPR